MIFVAPAVFCQKTGAERPPVSLLDGLKKPAGGFREISYPGDQPARSSQVIAPDFYASHLGFFCKQEIKLDKATKMSFRFRLGSVEACDRLEGKHAIVDNPR